MRLITWGCVLRSCFCRLLQHGLKRKKRRVKRRPWQSNSQGHRTKGVEAWTKAGARYGWMKVDCFDRYFLTGASRQFTPFSKRSAPEPGGSAGFRDEPYPSRVGQAASAESSFWHRCSCTRKRHTQRNGSAQAIAGPVYQGRCISGRKKTSCKTWPIWTCGAYGREPQRERSAGLAEPRAPALARLRPRSG